MSLSHFEAHASSHSQSEVKDRMYLEIWYLAIAMMLMLSGLVLGVAMQTHVNNLGWSCFALFGLVHRAYPELERSSLALPQFLLASVSAFFLTGGMWMIWAAGDGFGASAGGYGMIAATVLFIVMYFQRVVFVDHQHH